jgi:hypothetical protein
VVRSVDLYVLSDAEKILVDKFQTVGMGGLELVAVVMEYVFGVASAVGFEIAVAFEQKDQLDLFVVVAAALRVVAGRAHIDDRVMHIGA